ncbi:hypothetical protein NIES592_15050 [Fischerella major NIES-592]|uniref:Uma2 family endonuclease n=1 Tax=Fischerella major NIES-592 TaxID=210994 RepID=A0A1U7GYC7_9CYAN|nr:hypothetical protein [Fischerella major]OKH13377.1 hypothetical protein NIES592_15050 [Fischerella major NIES-592]
MVEQLLINNDDYYVPDASQLVTEDDTLLATGDERAKVAEQRAAQLAERLRSLGIDPDTL